MNGMGAQKQQQQRPIPKTRRKYHSAAKKIIIKGQSKRLGPGGKARQQTEN